MNHTTKRFPRSIAEAFGHVNDARSAYPIERYKRAMPDWLDAIGIGCLMALPAVATVFWFPNGF